MKVSVTFNCDNASFDENRALEIAEILRNVANEINRDETPCSSIIFDRNGNLIGEYSVTGY
jgi:hypothetical protein